MLPFLLFMSSIKYKATASSLLALLSIETKNRGKQQLARLLTKK